LRSPIVTETGAEDAGFPLVGSQQIIVHQQLQTRANNISGHCEIKAG
jgi:hypothetical protein